MLLYLVHGARTADEAARVMAKFAGIKQSAVDLVSAGSVMEDGGLLVCVTPGTSWVLCAAADERAAATGDRPPFEQCTMGRLLAFMPQQRSQHEHRNWVFKSSPPVQESKTANLFGIVRHLLWQASAMGLCPPSTRVCLLPGEQRKDDVSLVLCPGTLAPVEDPFLHLVTLINVLLAESPVTTRMLAWDGPVKTDTKQTITLRMALDGCNDPGALRDFSWRPSGVKDRGGGKRAPAARSRGAKGQGKQGTREKRTYALRARRGGSADGPPRKRPKAPQVVVRKRTRSGSVRLESSMLCESDSDN